MSLLSERPGRAEARTAEGWQRFDRAAAMGALALVVVFGLLSVVTAWRDDSPPAPQGDPLARVETPRSAETASGGTAARDAGDGTAPGAGGASAGTGGERASIPVARTGERPTGAGPAPGNPATGTPQAGPAPAVRASGASDRTAAAPSGRPATTPAMGGSPPAAAATKPESPPYLERMPDAGPAATPRPLHVPGLGPPGQPGDTGADSGSLASTERIPNRSEGPLPAPGAAAVDGGETTALLDPILDMRAGDGRLQIDGILGSEDMRRDLVRAALRIYGMRNLTDRLAVSPGVAPMQWPGKVDDLMVLLGGPESALRVRVSGDMVTLSGSVDTLDDKLAKGLQAQQIFGTTAIIDNRIEVPGAAPLADAGRSNDVVQAGEAARSDTGGEGPRDGAPASPDAAATPAGNAAGADTPAAPAPAGPPAERALAPASPEPGVPPDAEGGPQAAAGEVRAPSRGAPDEFKLNECARVVTSVYVTFDSASARLDPATREILDDILPCLPRRQYVVGGHTDNRGEGASNRVLSQMRADAVKAYLVERGAEPGGLVAVGHGETRPVATNRDKDGRARNRRVDFRLEN